MENDPPVEDADGTDFGEIFGNSENMQN